MRKLVLISASVVGSAVGGYALSHVQRERKFWKTMDKIATAIAEAKDPNAETNETLSATS